MLPSSPSRSGLSPLSHPLSRVPLPAPTSHHQPRTSLPLTVPPPHSAIYSGHQIGSILSLLFSPLLLERGGVDVMFVVYGTAGFV